jgi:ankyrin repeat protein
MKGGGVAQALMWAASEDHIELVAWLLEQGAAVDEGNNYGYTALWLASYHGCTAVVRRLIKAGADWTSASNDGWTPLMIASTNGHHELVRCLLDRPGAAKGINHRAPNGKTALWWACYRGRGEVARALLERGADASIASSDGASPMDVAKQEPPHKRISAEGRRECVVALEVRGFLVWGGCFLFG